MTIRYADGRNTEAVLLSHTENTMRVAINGSDDATELTAVNGAWFSGDREPVQPEFAWQSRSHVAAPPASDCICSAELASMLIDLLFTHSR